MLADAPPACGVAVMAADPPRIAAPRWEEKGVVHSPPRGALSPPRPGEGFGCSLGAGGSPKAGCNPGQELSGLEVPRGIALESDSRAVCKRRVTPNAPSKL